MPYMTISALFLFDLRTTFKEDYPRTVPSTFGQNPYNEEIVISRTSDIIISGLVTNETAKICCLGLILALFYSAVVRKMILDNN